MNEVTVTTQKLNHLIDPVLQIWGTEVAAYLFLGGLTAGALVIASLVWLTRNDTRYRWAAGPLLAIAPLLISAGMFGLLLDLEYPTHVYRFYMAFEPTSPMSWGSWLLLLVYPLNILLLLGTWETSLPNFRGGVMKRLPGVLQRLVAMLERFATARRVFLAWGTLATGLGLGIYTGILLSAYTARPFWNSGVLGPLFLVSGVSTALALVMLGTKDARESADFLRFDVGVVIFELLLLFVYGYNLFTSTQSAQQAIKLVAGGPLTTMFWVPFALLGLFLPLGLELAELRGTHSPKWLAPVLLLMGGFFFRVVMVQAGQLSAWTNY